MVPGEVAGLKNGDNNRHY